jgi:hypothetical protein
MEENTLAIQRNSDGLCQGFPGVRFAQKFHIIAKLATLGQGVIGIPRCEQDLRFWILLWYFNRQVRAILSVSMNKVADEQSGGSR